jgi:hypothetical protein
VRVYLEATHHLQRPSRGEVVASLERIYGPLAFETVLGHDQIAAADVSIATSPSTAETVTAHTGSLFKAYLIDDDRERSDGDAPEQGDEAHPSEALPLHCIVYGQPGARPRRGISGDADWLDVAPDASSWGTTAAQLEAILTALAVVRLGPRATA